jgi:hypothetical protein
MSWDIFVQDFPKDATTIDDISDDFQPALIGPRLELIALIKEVVPNADFSDPSWGLINSNDWSIEIDMGSEDECNGIAFHIRGGDEAAGLIAAILDHLDLRALDSQSGDFFVAGPEAMDSLKKWREYREKVLSEKG